MFRQGLDREMSELFPKTLHQSRAMDLGNIKYRINILSGCGYL